MSAQLAATFELTTLRANTGDLTLTLTKDFVSRALDTKALQENANR